MTAVTRWNGVHEPSPQQHNAHSRPPTAAETRPNTGAIHRPARTVIVGSRLHCAGGGSSYGEARTRER